MHTVNNSSGLALALALALACAATGWILMSDSDDWFKTFSEVPVKTFAFTSNV